jgi:prophage regulatory protein
VRTIRLPDVETKIGLKKSTIYALVRQGDFPLPIKLGPRASAWVESQIDDWLRKRVVVSSAKTS